MTHVIRTIKIHPVPTRGESHIDHDARRARLLWEVECLWRARIHVLQTCVRELSELLRLGFGAVGRVSCLYT